MNHASTRSRRKGKPRKVNVESFASDNESDRSTADNASDIRSTKRRQTIVNKEKTNSSRLRCDFCCITFPNELCYDLHMSIHDPDGEIVVDSAAEEEDMWQVPQDESNPTGVKVFHTCHICNKSFIYQKSFHKHLLDAHGETTCSKCLQCFVDKERLNEHSCIVRVTAESENGRIDVKNDYSNKRKKVSANTSLKCDLCEKTFARLSDLKKHAVCHSDETPFPCEKCPKRFKRKKNLVAHLKRCAGSSKIELTCSRCPKTFCTPGYLRMHEKVHDGTNPYYCQQCDKYFLKKSKLQRHLASHERKKSGEEKVVMKVEYKCSFCEKTFLDKRNHDMHERIHKGTNPYYCQECDHYFLKRRHLVHHEKSKHSDETPYSCEKCEKRFKFAEALASHMRFHDKEAAGGGKFQCITCHRLFVNLVDLKEHLITSTTCISMECTVCGQRFLRKKQLNRHMVVHTKEKPFKCENCDRTFAFRWELTKHERSHSKDKQLPCDLCHETFIQTSDLNDHLIWHKTGRYPKQCPYCARCFKKKSKLEIHIRGVHEGRRDYICITCGKDFKRKHDLKRHEVFHESERENDKDVLMCIICDQKGFTEKTLQTHQLSHMRVESNDKTLSLETLTQFNENLPKDESTNHDGIESTEVISCSEKGEEMLISDRNATKEVLNSENNKEATQVLIASGYDNGTAEVDEELKVSGNEHIDNDEMVKCASNEGIAKQGELFSKQYENKEFKSLPIELQSHSLSSQNPIRIVQSNEISAHKDMDTTLYKEIFSQNSAITDQYSIPTQKDAKAMQYNTSTQNTMDIEFDTVSVKSDVSSTCYNAITTQYNSANLKKDFLTLNATSSSYLSSESQKVTLPSSSTFTHVIHNENPQAKMLFSDSMKLPPSDTQLFQPNKSDDSSTSVEKKGFSSTCDTLENFSSLVSSLHPDDYVFDLQNNYNVGRESQPNLDISPSSNVFVTAETYSPTSNDLSHNGEVAHE